MGKILLNTCKNWAGRVLVLAAVACASVFVSCSDEFDDTQLKNDINDLKDRVSALEKKLTSEIEALQTLINGKITINTFGYNEETGIYTIALSNDETIEVAKATGDPVVSVVEEEGAFYWTVNGEPLLDAAGKKLPVAVAPGVRVNESTNAWEVSPDGGKTWVTTGIDAGSYGAALIAKVDEDDSYVYFTLSDGTRLSVAKTVDFRCRVLSSKKYFTYGQTVEVTLDMNGVKKATVTKPDGWKAGIEENILTITAPVEANEYAEKSGKVAVFVVGNNDKSDIVELEVAIGEAPHVIELDGRSNISITVGSQLTQENNWVMFYYGAMKYSEFDPEKLVEYVKDNSSRLHKSQVALPESEDKQINLADLVGEIDPAEDYVVWAVDVYRNGYYQEYSSDISYSVYIVPNVSFEVRNVAFDAADIAVKVKGMASYYAGSFSPTNPGGSYIRTIDDLLVELNSGGYWSFTQKMTVNYEGALDKFAKCNSPLKPGNTYTIFAFQPGLTGYTAEDIYKHDVVLPAVTLGGTATVTIDKFETTYSTVKATITPGNGTYKFFMAYISEEDMAQYTTDEALLTYLVNQNGRTEAYDFTKSSLKAGSKGWIVAVGVDKTGKAGSILKKEADTDILTFNEKTVKVEVAESDYNRATIKVTPDDGLLTYRYYARKRTQWNNDFLCNAPAPGGTGRVGDIKKTEEYLPVTDIFAYMTHIKEGSFADLTDNKIELTGLDYSEEYVFLFMSRDADKSWTHLTETSFTPDFTEKIVRSDKPEWINSTSRPVISNIKFDGTSLDDLYTQSTYPTSGRASMTCTVSPGEGSTEFYVYAAVNSNFGNEFGKRTATVMNKGKKSAGEPIEVSASYWGFASYVLGVVWRDADGVLYEADLIDLKKYAPQDPETGA